MNRKAEKNAAKGIPMMETNGLTAIAASMLRAIEQDSLKTIFITSCRAGEGKTTTALNIARALIEEAGKRILVIDGNHEAPTLHRFFKVDFEEGIVDLIHKRVEPGRLLAMLGRDQLTVLPYGNISPRNLDFYRADRFKPQLDALAEPFDLVIFDGPSIFGKQDPGTIAGAFDGTVLVIECEQTPWEVVQSGKRRLEEIGSQLLGAVLNKRKYYIPRGLYA